MEAGFHWRTDDIQILYNEYYSFYILEHTVYACSVASVVSDFFSTSWTVTCQAPLSMGFSRQEYWIGLPFFSPEDLPDSGNKPTSARVSYIAGRFLIAEPPEKPPNK